MCRLAALMMIGMIWALPAKAQAIEDVCQDLTDRADVMAKTAEVFRASVLTFLPYPSNRFDGEMRAKYEAASGLEGELGRLLKRYKETAEDLAYQARLCLRHQ